MIKITVLLALCTALAWCSERYTNRLRQLGQPYSVWRDHAYLLLVAVLVLFTGLRTHYNDTTAYISGFKSSQTLVEFFSEPKNLEPLKNPLFYAYRSLLKTGFDDAQVLIFTTSLFTQACFIRFFKRYSHNFTFSVLIYITLGTLCLTLAAIKQTVAMAILTLAFPYLKERKWLSYYLVVFIAMLVHTYALAFAILPLFLQKPWKLFTYLFAAAMIVVMLNFKEVITEFLEQADDLGKTIAEYEVFDDHTVNIFRLAVYAVAPMISLLFRKWIFRNSTDMDHVLVHMSIISLAFMAMGTQSGANMFARMASYFELGTICCLPWMLQTTFEKRSYRFVSAVAAVCFFGYFIYAYGINMDFNAEYKAIGWGSLFGS